MNSKQYRYEDRGSAWKAEEVKEYVKGCLIFKRPIVSNLRIIYNFKLIE